MTSSHDMDREKGRRYDDPPNLYADGALGLFTVIALIFLVWGYCWLKSYSSWRIPQTIKIIFHEVAGLNVNAGVFVNGVRVGIVDKLEWQERERVLVQLRINAAKVEIPEGSKFVILTNGIVGAKYVEIVLPPPIEGKRRPQLDASQPVLGEDPVRPELAVNNIAIGLSKIDMEELHDNFEADRGRLVRAADQLSELAKKAMPVVERALPLEEEFLLLSQDMRAESKQLVKLLSSDKLGKDVRKTVAAARETLQTAQSIMDELKGMLEDKELRKDLVTTLTKLNEATANIEKSVEIVQKVAENKEIRNDLKEILSEARSSLKRVDVILKKTNFGGDIKKTLNETRKAVEQVDQTAQRLNQILDKRFPLVQMMFGRPGHLEKKGK